VQNDKEQFGRQVGEVRGWNVSSVYSVVNERFLAMRKEIVHNEHDGGC